MESSRDTGESARPSYVESTLEFTVAAQLDKDDFVERQSDQVEGF